MPAAKETVPVGARAPTSWRSIEKPVILFDGVCNLCNRVVLFVIDRDRSAHFVFASLQSETARHMLQTYSFPIDVSTLVLVEDGRVSTRSTAALRIASGLGMPWSLCRVLMLMPRPARDLVYDWVARHRYGWFGRLDSCRLPTPELRARFLDTL